MRAHVPGRRSRRVRSYFGVSDLGAVQPRPPTSSSRSTSILLVGPWPEAADLWAERSPVRHAELLSSPLLILARRRGRGGPPAQAEVIVKALEHRGLPVRLPAVRGRAARVPQGGEHLRADCRPSSRSTARSSVSSRARSSAAAGDREPRPRAAPDSYGCVRLRRGRGGPVRRPDPRSREGHDPLVADGTLSRARDGPAARGCRGRER